MAIEVKHLEVISSAYSALPKGMRIDVKCDMGRGEFNSALEKRLVELGLVNSSGASNMRANTKFKEI